MNHYYGGHNVDRGGAAWGILDAFTVLGEKLNELNASIGTLECAQLIKPYNRNPMEFKDWVKSIEKCLSYAVPQ